MHQIINFLHASFASKAFHSRDRQTLKKMLQTLQPSNHELNVLRSELFKLAEQSSNPEIIQLVHWIEEVNKCLLPKTEEHKIAENRCYFSPGDDCENAIVSSIKNARNSIKVCVFTISENEISQALIEAHKNGIAVRIITDDEKRFDKGSDVQLLSDAGVRIRIDNSSNHMHHKFCIIDKSILLTGSYNWTKSAADKNQENLLITEDPKMVKSYLDEFEKLWDHFQEI